jgi:hypothetical protein
MLQATKPKCGGKGKRRIRFHGINAAARALGVERTHLYRVLAGKRESKRLMEEYRAWEARQS